MGIALTFTIITLIFGSYIIYALCSRITLLEGVMHRERDRYFKISSELDRTLRGRVYFHNKSNLLFTLNDCTEIGDI